MFVISTRNFPPELGGIQALMGGLAQNLLNYGPVKVFADKKSDQDKAHDEKSSLDIERIAGIKLFRKYRKSGVVNEFIKNQNNIRALILDHWKSLEHLDKNIIKGIASKPNQKPITAKSFASPKPIPSLFLTCL